MKLILGYLSLQTVLGKNSSILSLSYCHFVSTRQLLPIMIALHLHVILNVSGDQWGPNRQSESSVHAKSTCQINLSTRISQGMIQLFDF